ncbi:protein kinase [Cystobacter fuscus DSM 2262]|uniref:non-specific serine/threonine protein kinase n=1 Tax=Cystobacter fuscus (strain ATCC 25194 / DSM 2262 / NBRC 100088 / M29) TaxID=1242864 RepID=S9Q8P9_CYSF2|nr:serine/threonine-protein kinase [Cystobacter fuscus]EPX57709.1 protein kinase [Cystobacter fuscus DSM 2262]
MFTNSGTMYPGALAPGTQVGRWRVVERLGVGGQGAVYRVEDMAHPGDFYALKLALHAHDGRAEREVALVMTRAVHPHVVGFHGCARWPHPREGCLGFVMDWISGLPLHLWAETGDTTFRQLAVAGATVALTLGELHARGVLHRDLKPEHILMRESDGQPVLLDFGVGWYEGAHPLTTGPLPPGTLHLLSPEAVRFLWNSAKSPGEHYTFQATDDLYALGVCLYRAVTGHYPLNENLYADLLQYAIVHVRPLAPVEVNPRVPRALSDVIVRLLEKEPQARYPSGAAVHEALVAAVSGEPEGWDVPLFDWEEAPPAQEGDKPQRRILRPARPKPSWTSPPPKPRSTTGLTVERSRWPTRLALATAVLLALVPMTFAPRIAPRVPTAEEAWATDVHVDPAPARYEQAPLPVRNQKRAPCTARLEIELSGACWVSLRQRPPNCPPQTVEYDGQCFLPVAVPRPVPSSVDGGAPDE